MYEPLRSLDRDLDEISRLVHQTLSIAGSTETKAASEKYLSVVLNARALKEMWSLHIHMEQNLIDSMAVCDRYFAAYLKRITEEGQAIELQLASLGTAPWPRSPQWGLHAIRPRITHVLTQLLRQIERERVTVLPLLHRWKPAAIETEDAVSMAV